MYDRDAALGQEAVRVEAVRAEEHQHLGVAFVPSVLPPVPVDMAPMSRANMAPIRQSSPPVPVRNRQYVTNTSSQYGTNKTAKARFLVLAFR